MLATATVTLTLTETGNIMNPACQLLRHGDGVKVKHPETQRNPRAGSEDASIVAPRIPGGGSVKTPF